MAATVDKLERLLNLTAALLDAVRPLTAEELRSRVPGYPEEKASFRRQFERDKDDLRQMGVPLRVEEVPGSDPPVDGYRIHKQEYELRDPGLEPDELAALHLAASMVRLAGVSGDEALWKLGGVPTEEGDTTTVGVDLPAHEALGALFGAVGERHPVGFTYGGVRRVVEPLALHFERGRWYLVAHDRTRDARRSFRLDRIEGEVEVDGSARFAPRDDVPRGPASPWEIGDDDAVVARVRIDPDQATWAVRTLGPDTVEEVEADGSVVLSLEVVDRAALRTFVLGFLEHAEVLSPPDVRAEIVSWLEALA